MKHFNEWKLGKLSFFYFKAHDSFSSISNEIDIWRNGSSEEVVKGIDNTVKKYLYIFG